ncbi:MAG: SpoIIE family protein phosphatase [Lentisphaerae bacterium]|jgi:phosphoserine phosphatase RsbU/P|nr:SpoIIE family protein phosphatase [Lentisphaerota bacterium]MBT4822750.1 SpoIIE family protein phosphatase [Lentisphaerota bacterium]MBT5605831.1 SpoIIE family protein phosphatase [Lentisphaerota bacterium]MBT7061304.1 SpoIIE family protein phosphatase [Lentisphaerota bacterium]MBT7846666.1 SpoIIE family protein phosphatase [Lentisphaerota bacterium]
MSREEQMSTLPQKSSPLNNRREFELCLATKSCRGTTRDFHDAFLLNQDTLCFAVGNVGKSTRPEAEASLRTAAADAATPCEVLQRVKCELPREAASAESVTLSVGMLDLETGQLSYVDDSEAPSLLIRHPGAAEPFTQVRCTATSGGADCLNGTVRLGSGDGVLLSTGGIAEERFQNAIARHWPGRLETVVDAVLNELQDSPTVAAMEGTAALLALRFYGHAGKEADCRRIELLLEGGLQELAKAHEACERFAEHHGLDKSTSTKITLAIEELATNAATHGRQKAASEVRITVSLVHDAGSAIVTIEDTGRPFDPTQVPAPDLTASLEDRAIGGLGVYLVLKAMDDVVYEVVRGRNVVRLRKQIR